MCTTYFCAKANLSSALVQLEQDLSILSKKLKLADQSADDLEQTIKKQFAKRLINKSDAQAVFDKVTRLLENYKNRKKADQEFIDEIQTELNRIDRIFNLTKSGIITPEAQKLYNIIKDKIPNYEIGTKFWEPETFRALKKLEQVHDALLAGLQDYEKKDGKDQDLIHFVKKLITELKKKISRETHVEALRNKYKKMSRDEIKNELVAIQGKISAEMDSMSLEQAQQLFDEVTISMQVLPTELSADEELITLAWNSSIVLRGKFAGKLIL